jgi:hypothetical protein
MAEGALMEAAREAASGVCVSTGWTATVPPTTITMAMAAALPPGSQISNEDDTQ